MWIKSQSGLDLYPIGLGGFYPYINHRIKTKIVISPVNDNGGDVWYDIADYKTAERTSEVFKEIMDAIWNDMNGEPQIYIIPEK